MRSLLITCILIGLAAVAAPQLFTHYLNQPVTANVVEASAPSPEAENAPPPGVRQVLHSVDLYVDRSGLVYITDFNAGLYVLEWTGQPSVF